MKEQDLKNSHPLDAYFEETNELEKQSKENNPSTTYESHFTEQDKQKIDELSKQIVPLDNDALLKFGSNAQGNLSNFSHKMLDEVQSKDVGPIGDTLQQLMSKLQEVDPDELNQKEQSIFKRIFKRTKNSIQQVFTKMQSVGSQVDRISVQLEKNKNTLMRDIKLLDELYNQNKDYFDVLNIYIAAAKKKKEDIETITLPELRNKAKQQDGNQMAVQDVADMEQFVDRLDKRIYDLQLSRQITLQSAPQIRMIQNINQALAEKIQSSILTSIPLWKNQMAIALTLMRQHNAVEAQKQVTNTTNELLVKNSEMLKHNAVETAKENERGIVDIETLRTTQDNIIETIEETLRIQDDGRKKRQAAEVELQQLETDLREKLTINQDNRDRLN
ncbi:toxic anion resistance protein [Staphylococcus massiliensis]|uniref:toxic anion resistance protein n=1 Tax=Staphylococcus massiliensis TaxID=555791 RepID=UPI001EE08F7E|nr:toxic anion resistance protein [Staphylococcus massiliensis]MCG3398586.1 toxic anion resistance protein [Staphylococcus massiliensis]MCG3401151.1 toxic anion resistance protein [Staphylococcus massiliensis]